MESNANRQSQPQGSASRLSPFAEPFTLKRPPALLSKAHSFGPPSSCLELQGLSPDDSASQTFQWQGYTAEGPEEGLDLTHCGTILHGGKFSGSICFGDSTGSLYFSPNNDLGEKKKNTSDLTADGGSEKEGVKAWGRSKSLDGTQSSPSRELTGKSERGVQPRSQSTGPRAVENASLMKLGHQITPITTSSLRALSSFTGVNNVSLNLKRKEPEGGGAVDGSFKNDLNSKEPDEDSPCWRGTMNSPKSPFAPTQCAKTKFPGSPSGARPTLNPMAPHFIPRNAERMLSSTWIGSFGSDEIRKLDDECSLRDKTSSLHLLGPLVLPPLPEEENIASHKNIVTGSDLQDHRNDIEDVSVSEVFLRISNYLSTCPSLDAELVVDTMHDFSEFLVRKHSESYVLSEPLVGKIQGIIQNLSMCSGERDSRRSSSPLNKSSPATSKIPNIELHQKVAINATSEVGNVGNHRPQETDSSLFVKKVCYPGAFVSNIGSEIAQAGGNASIPGLWMEQGMSPQTLLYKNLWLQATEELQSMKSRSLRSTKSGAERTPGRVS